MDIQLLVSLIKDLVLSGTLVFGCVYTCKYYQSTIGKDRKETEKLSLQIDNLKREALEKASDKKTAQQALEEADELIQGLVSIIEGMMEP